MTIDPVIPDYTSACLSNIVPALLEHSVIGSGWLPEEVLSAQKIVLLLVDGLGYEKFKISEQRDLLHNLSKMNQERIMTVAPTTTATALTSLTTGRPPGEHGVIGYKISVGNQILNSLRWTTGSGVAVNEINPSSFQPVPPFLGEKIPVVSPAEFRNSGFTEAHLRNTLYEGYFLPSNITHHIAQCLDQGSRLVYAYYDGLDKVGHIHGTGYFYDAEIAFVDYLIGRIYEMLPRGTALIVTSDHGMVDVGDSIIRINDSIMQRTDTISGEARFLWFHPARGNHGSLLQDLQDLYSNCAWVRSKDQVLDEGWFGRHISNQAKERLGEIALLARDPIAFVDKENLGPLLVGRHGSLTEAEVYVPLITSFKD